MGTPDFAVSALRALVEAGHEIVGVVTTADKPAGRGRKLMASAVKQYAIDNLQAPVLQPEKLRDETFLSELRALQADLFVVVAFRMLPEVVWAMPPKGTINLHGSLLPDYRGAAPINRAVINGDTRTGATTFFIEKEIDTGAMIDRTEIEIGPDDDAGTVHDRLAEAGAALLARTVAQIAEGKAKTVRQETVAGNWRPAPKIFKDDCRLNWNAPAEELRNKIRGLSPYPAAWTVLKGSDGEEFSLKVFSASTASKSGKTVGSWWIEDKTRFMVQCADAALELHELQLQGKKRMLAADLLRGLDSARFETILH